MSMTRKQIEALYPGAVDAVSLAERGGELVPELWPRIRDIGIPPHECVSIMRETAVEMLDKISPTIGPRGICQFDHPDFLTYVKGKLGAF